MKIYFTYNNKNYEYEIKKIFLTVVEPTNLVLNELKPINIDDYVKEPITICKVPLYIGILFENINNNIFLNDIKNVYIKNNNNIYYIKPDKQDIYIIENNILLKIVKIQTIPFYE